MVSLVVYWGVLVEASSLIWLVITEQNAFFGDLFGHIQVARFSKVGACIYVYVCVWVNYINICSSPHLLFLTAMDHISHGTHKAKPQSHSDKQTNLIPVIIVSTLCFLV